MVAVRVIVFGIMMMVVVMLFAEQPGADEIDHKPNHGDGNRFCVGDGDRPRQSHQTLIGDHGLTAAMMVAEIMPTLQAGFATMVGATGIEPVTPAMSTQCSYR